MKCTWKFVYTRHSRFTRPDLTWVGAIFSKHLKLVYALTIDRKVAPIVFLYEK